MRLLVAFGRRRAPTWEFSGRRTSTILYVAPWGLSGGRSSYGDQPAWPELGVTLFAPWRSLQQVFRKSSVHGCLTSDDRGIQGLIGSSHRGRRHRRAPFASLARAAAAPERAAPIERRRSQQKWVWEWEGLLI